MNKKRLTVLALMMALLMVLSTAMLVACDKSSQDNVGDETTVTIKPTEGLLISNGDFKVTKTSTYPMSADGWTGAAMYSSGSYPKGVIAGVVSLEEALYTASMSKWNDNGTIYGKLKSHYSSDEDAVNNALMIYMPTKAEITDAKTQDYGPTAYGFTSSSFNLESNKYYKLSVDVLTYDIKGSLDDEGNQKADSEPGARIYVSSATYAEYANVNTNGEWATYTFYFESAVASKTSLTVQLGLGKYNSEYTVGLTTGYAFFDNLTLEEVDQEVYAAEKDACENGKGEVSAEDYRKNTQTQTLKVNNGRFDFGTTKVGTTAAASNWKVITGTDAVSGLGKNGVIDVTKFADNYSKYASTYYVSADGTTAELQYPANRLVLTGGAAEVIGNFGDNRIGNNVFMLSQQRMTAQGLQSSKPIIIEKGKHYAISVSVYTYDINGAGVTLTLSGEGKDISIKGISSNPSSTEFNGGLPEIAGANGTNGGWTTYTFYIEGNQYKDYSYTMTFWLGTGGKGDNNAYTYENWESSSKKSEKEYTTYLANGTFSTGWAFFDELNLEEIDHATYQTINDGADTDFEVDANDANFGGFAKVSLHSDNLFTTLSANFTSFAQDSASYDDNTLGTPEGFSAQALFDKVAEDDTLPAIDVTSGVVSIADGQDFSAYGIENPGKPYNIDSDYALMFKANSDSYFFYETADFAIAKNSYYRVSLWVKTVDVKATAGLHVYLLDDEDDTLLTFASINTTVTDGDETTSEWTEYTFYIRGHESEDKMVSLKFQFGTGDRWTSSTLANGAAFVANMSMTAIEYSDYSGAKTGTTAKSVSLADTATVKNSFDNGSFSSYDVESEGLADAYGILENSTKAAAPTDWTLSDKTYKPNGDNDTTGADTKKSYTDDSNLVAGVLKLDKQTDDNNFYNASSQIVNVFGATIADKFNTLYGTEDDTYFDNVDRIGAPYVLALAGLNDKAYSRRFTSDTFSLSSGNNYEVKVWVKTIGTATFSIYLTGGASGNTYFGQDANFVVTSTDQDWTCYTFYIEVGLTPVSSLRVALGLGYDKEISGDLSAKGHNEYSSGVVLFDNVTLTSTTTTDEFDAITEDTIKDTERKISYLSDGFDVASESIEAHTELTAPSGWTGKAGLEQDSKNTNGGVVYADASVLPTHNVDKADAEDPLYSALIADLGQTVSLFGKEYDYTDSPILQSEIEAARADYEDKTDEEIKVVLQKIKMYNEMKENYISTSELLSALDKDGNNISSALGKNFLVINNTAASAYTYTSANYGLNAETCYRVSVWVRTYNVTGAGATVEFYLGSANEKDNPFSFTTIGTKEGENGTTAWTKYTFYVKTLEENVSSATIKLSLGEHDPDDKSKLSKGYAMFDAIEFEIIDEAEFDSAVAGDYVAVRTVAKDSESGDVADKEEETEKKNEFNLEMLTWMIPTIVIAIAIIAVVCVYFYKKLKKPAKAKTTVTNTEAITEKRSKYDESNE